jgi:fluoride exporter
MSTAWLQAMTVGAGAAVGAMARWRVGLLLGHTSALGFPMGTLLVNALGGFLMGVALATLARSSWLHLALVTGFLGGFTTFSAFSAESLSLLQRGHGWLATWHALAHVAGALGCTALGLAITKALMRA